MPEFARVAAIGDADLLLPLRVLGIRVISPGSVEEAREALRRLEREKFALCFLHERWFGPLAPERRDLGRRLGPAVVGFSDYRSVASHLEVMLREMAVKATGSDALVKRKG